MPPGPASERPEFSYMRGASRSANHQGSAIGKRNRKGGERPTVVNTPAEKCGPKERHPSAGSSRGELLEKKKESAACGRR